MAGPGVILGRPHCPLRFLRCQCCSLEQLSFRRRFSGFSARFDTGIASSLTTTPRLLLTCLPVFHLCPLGSGLKAASSLWETGCCCSPVRNMKHISWFPETWVRNVLTYDILVFISLRFSDVLGLLSSWFIFWVWKVWTCKSIFRFVPVCSALHWAASIFFLHRR